MCKPAFFLLLFSLSLNAQHPQPHPAFGGATFFGGSNGFSLPDASPSITKKEDTLPNAPEPQPSRSRSVEGGPPAAVSTAQLQAPGAVGTRAEVWNKKFLAAHAAFLGSIVYDTELTHQGLAHHNCVEGNPNLASHPSRGDLYRVNALVFGAITGFDWFAERIRMRFVPYIGPIVGSAVHLTGGSKWLAQCW